MHIQNEFDVIIDEINDENSETFQSDIEIDDQKLNDELNILNMANN